MYKFELIIKQKLLVDREIFWWKIYFYEIKSVENCWWTFLISLNPLLLKNIAYFACLKNVVFVFCMSLQRKFSLVIVITR